MDGGTEANYIYSMQKWARQYPDCGFGTLFSSWIFQENPRPYNSFGNGSAMRVSPVAWFYNTLEDVENAAAISASVTHNHLEGIRGAQATAAAVFLARTGNEKEEIQAYIEKRFNYDLSLTCDEIRPDYFFNETCQETVPQAIVAWLESDCFEDAIRNAVSLGGDSDTLAAITGAVAQAYYGIPPFIAVQAYQRLDALLQMLCRDFMQRIMCQKY